MRFTIFETWLRRAKRNSAIPLLPRNYTSCYAIALRRLAVAINPSFFPRGILAKDDDAIKNNFKSQGLDERSFCAFGIQYLDDKVIHRALEAEDIATNFFYGYFDYKRHSHQAKNGKQKIRTRIVYNLTEAFLKYSYDGLHRPRDYDGREWSPSDLGYAATNVKNRYKIARECAANYLLRNFWHNIVHDIGQGITNNNFDEFRGRARYDSDFEADNLSWLFLAHSYGHRVVADDVGRKSPDARILQMLWRNRCNEMFADRAKDRRPVHSYDEAEFRACRTIAGYLSGWLLAQGLAATTLTVHAYGYIEVRKGSHYYRNGKGFAICVNGYRIYFPTELQATFTREERARYMKELATNVQTQYQKALSRDPSLKSYAAESLESTFRRFGLST